ncbi:hypothetical protein WJX72_000579 [[Myrmecia] bisecta]|uniref:Ammonium transporter n=1 Tax=[Myrmecia] bisecta TaxID=41462 RepID=A0AAW1P3R6_9CHLO
MAQAGASSWLPAAELPGRQFRKLLQQLPFQDPLQRAYMQALSDDLDVAWMLLGSFLIFFMQCGFAMLEAGLIRAKNTKNILLKSLMDSCLGGLMWWACGYSFAFGKNQSGGAFIGSQNFLQLDLGANHGKHWGSFMFQFAFAITAIAIVSGAVAERCQFRAYVINTAVLAGFTYPVAAHWVWSSQGWLSAFRPEGPLLGGCGLIDFAGSGVVHITGGACALVAAWQLGPRFGRFNEDGTVNNMPGHSVIMATLGTFILWFGWYGFNPMSTQKVLGQMETSSKVAVNTTLAAASGGLFALLIDSVYFKCQPDVPPMLNGCISALVGITGNCAVVEPYAAVVIGCVAVMFYRGAVALLVKLQIDDPIDASCVHFGAGVWGLLASGLFARAEDVLLAYGIPGISGVFYGGNGRQLGLQLLGMACLSAWSLAMSWAVFAGLRRCGMLRVNLRAELQGLDAALHGGYAYDFCVEEDINVENVMAIINDDLRTQPVPESILALKESLNKALRKPSGPSLAGSTVAHILLMAVGDHNSSQSSMSSLSGVPQRYRTSTRQSLDTSNAAAMAPYARHSVSQPVPRALQLSRLSAGMPVEV